MHRMRRLTTHLMAAPLSKAPSSHTRLLSTQTTATATTDSPCVLIEETPIGNYLVTLNRPKALNSLNTEMINILTPFYQKLSTSSTPCTVVMRGAGPKAFCAGGDVRSLYDLGMANAPLSSITSFFTAEYELNALLGALPSHIANVCLLDGITMGGGVGLSVHGRIRIATPKTLFAMPETGIGFYTDVGGSHFLPRIAPKGLGLFLAMVGHRLKGADVLHSGIATHFVDEANMEAMVKELLSAKMESVHSVLAQHCSHRSDSRLNGGKFSLSKDLADISEVFDFEGNAKSVEAILEALRVMSSSEGGNEWAEGTLKGLESVSPTSLKVVFRALKEGRSKGLRECLQMELGIVTEFMKGEHTRDFYEGIRAVLVKKDRNPKWQPQTLSEVGNIDRYFVNA